MGAITNTTAPTLTDESGPLPAVDGDTLTTTTGSWTSCGEPITLYYYYWQRDGSDVTSGTYPPGGSPAPYEVVDADIGQTLESVIYACNADGCEPAWSSNSIVPVDRPPDTPWDMSPADGEVTGTTPTFSSIFSDLDPGQTGYVSYSVQRCWDGSLVHAGSGPVVSSDNASAWTTSTLPIGDCYEWDAQAGDNHGESSDPTDYSFIFVPPSTAQLQSPVSGNPPPTLFTTTPVLSASATSAAPLYFDFQVSSDSSFSNVVADSGWTAGTGANGSWSVTPGVLQRGTTYYWRARAEDYYQLQGYDTTSPSWSAATNTFQISQSGLGVNSNWPIWSHGPVSVNEANGNLVLSLPTPSYPTPAGSLTFSLTYNSQGSAATSSPGLGQGWTLAAGDGSMSPPLQLIDHNVAAPIYQGVEIDWPDGSSDSYTQVGAASPTTATTYLPGSADGSQLAKNPDGTWTLLEGDGTMYTFGQEQQSNGVALLTGAEVSATKTGNGLLSYSFTSGEITQLSYLDATGDQPSETLNFAWGTTCNGAPSLLCVTGPDQHHWAYTAATGSSEITGVNDGVRQLLALSYGSNGLINTVQNADDLQPSQASPGYNGNHSLALTYDGASPARVSCVIDGPTTSQAATPQPSCAGGNPASESTWSFGYHPGATEPTPPRASHYGTLVRNDAPDAYYPLDETSGTTAVDASGNGNNATYYGSYTPGQPGALAGSGGGTAVAFNGGGVTGNISNLDRAPGGYNTVEMWIKWDGTDNEMPFAFTGTGSGYDLWFYGGNFGFNSGAGDIWGTTAPTANAWHYIVAEFYNGSLTQSKLWVDGTQQTLSQVRETGSFSATASSAFSIAGDMPFTGEIDEVAVYGYALPPSEIASHFAEGLHNRLAAGYTTLTPPDQESPSATCPANCDTTYYDGQSNTIEAVDLLGRITESAYDGEGDLLWSEDAAGNATDYLYGGPNGEPTGNPDLARVLLQTIGPDPDGSGPMQRPVTTDRYDEETIGTPNQAGTPLSGLAGTYWTGTSLSGIPTVRENDPAPGAGAQTFDLPVSDSWPVSGPSSARWSGDINAPSAGDYTFSTVGDGGTRLAIDGSDTIDNWKIPTGTTTAQSTTPIHLSAGLHQIVLDYEVGSAAPTITLEWLCSDCGQPINDATAVPLTDLLPAWLNKTSTVSPMGRVSFSHYADPALGEPDYTLAQVGTSNLITSYSYDSYGRLKGKVMPDGNSSATINASGDLSGAGDPTTSNWGTSYIYYAPGAQVAPPSAPDCSGSSVPQNEQLDTATTHGDHTTTYVYDASGNTIATTRGAGTTCSQYDDENRLTSTRAPGDALPATYTYDPNGIQLTATGSTASYLGDYGHATSNTATRTKTITLTGAPGAGAAVFLRIANTTTAPSTTAVTDSEHNTWTLLDQGTTGVPNSLYATMQDAAPLKAGDVVTITWSTNVTGFAGTLDAFPGVTSLTPDKTATANSSTNTTARNTGTTATTTHAAELQIAAWGINAVETGFTPTTGANQFHTPYLTNNSQTTSEGEYRFVNATGAYNLNATGGVSSKYNGFIVTLPTVAPTTVTTYYDEKDRLIDTIDSQGAEAKYTYDPDGNQLSRTAAKGALASNPNYTTTYTYNSGDQLTSETDPDANTYSFFYDNRGNLRGTQYPNGTFSWIDTNPDGWTSDQYNRHGTISASTTPSTVPTDSNPLADYTYTYDEDGKRTVETRTSGSTSQTANYTYDNLGRLSQDTITGSPGSCRQYTYDVDSNRLSTEDYTNTACTGSPTTTNYTYDPSTTAGVDELTKITAGSNTTNYTYTSDGETQTQGTTNYTWDGWGRLSTATVGTNTITYTYDPGGALMSRTSSSPATTINYLLGDLFETNASGTITTSYSDGPSGDLASYNGPPTSTPTFLYYDAHGNLAAEANSSGNQTANHTYDPFGAPVDTVPANTTLHRFVGRWDKQYDTTTGLILMGARPYDPNTGRFLSVDPIPGGSLNNYDYAGQDPINDYDLSGDCFICSNPLGITSLVHRAVSKLKEQGAAAAAIPSYLAYYLAYEVRHHVINAPGLKTIERLGIHADMYLDRVEHAHGDPRTQYDEGVSHFQLGPFTLPWWTLPGAHGTAKHHKIDY